MGTHMPIMDQPPPDVATTDNGDQAARILSEQVRLLYQNALLAQTMVIILSLLLVAVMSHRDNLGLVLPWLGYMLLVCVYRLDLDRRYRRQQPAARDAPAWLRRFSVGALLAGLGWAVSALLFIPGAEREPQFFAILILVGVAVGALPILSSVLRVYLSYAGFILLPLVLILLLQPGDTYPYIALAGVLFMFGLGRSAHAIHRTVEETLRERFSREAAHAAMEQAYAKLRLVNQRLSEEVNQRLLVEADLRQAKEVAEAANRAKSDFLANMSHELRTPMNGILGMTELALSTQLNEAQRDFLQTALDSANGLLHLLNDLLDTARLDAGRLALIPRQTSLAEVLRGAVQRQARRAGDRGLKLELIVDPRLDDEVVLDRDALARVLNNLLDNAVKFTDQGCIEVHADREHCPDGVSCLHVCVSDTGIGIAADRMASIFDLFTQADSSSTRRHGGTGLGLGLASRLVALMRGRIWVESEPGQGSRFHVLLPTRPDESLGNG